MRLEFISLLQVSGFLYGLGSSVKHWDQFLLRCLLWDETKGFLSERVI